MVKVTTSTASGNSRVSKSSSNDLLDIAAIVRNHPHTPYHISQATGMSEAGVRKAIHRGDLKAIRVGKMFRISDEAVAEWLGISA